MKFKFPLQKVLEHRKILEGMAQKDFQEAVALLNEAQNKYQKMADDMHAAQVRVAALIQDGRGPGPALGQIDEFLRGQKVLLARQGQKIQEIEKLVEAKREILRQSALDYKIIDKMRENKLEAFKHEQGVQEQKDMDEQSILRFKTKES